MLRKFARPRKSLKPLPVVPEGQRVYAIGDVHGRLDLLEELLTAIAANSAARGPAAVRLVMLGDLIDRGPCSRQVIDRVIALREEYPGMFVLTGNHEEILIHALDGEREALKLLLRVGGETTLNSYGISPAECADSTLEELSDRLQEVVPSMHRRFLHSLESAVTIGDYMFVHAGVRPDVPLAEQKASDMRWIRDEFLRNSRDHGAVIVHGHSISPAVEERDNRIGIDTGAYATGTLTALGLENAERWYLST